MVELVVRLAFSLAVIIGMLLLLARFSAKRFRGNAASLVRVVHRQPLSRTSAVAVVTVGSRVLVLGTTEQQVQLLTELDADEVAASTGVPFPTGLSAPTGAALELVPPTPYAPRHAASAPSVTRATTAARAADGALAGSVLSVQTWKQALAAATSRTRDAS